ncbi:MAG: glycine cleavage system aminomethyltransferase GcvT [Balneolaceae bacterium]|nr:glycine cleavage system aminomethyltransferase GcvT [Balneolaceae bacterium]
MPEQTPFYHIHQKLGARLTDFGGFDMPVQYESIKKEHRAVRSSVGLFDVSHMGEFRIFGPEAQELVQYLTINDASALTDNQAQYSAMCYEDGGIVDDLLVYRLPEGSGYMLVVNAANIEKDLEWIQSHNRFDAEVENRSSEICLLAVQGPKSPETLQKITDLELDSIRFYRYAIGNLGKLGDITYSATGYTGEKGFELYFDRSEVDAEAAWNLVMEAGADCDIVPCGLGARDTLRLEMGYALYGNDITKDTNPLEAGMGWLTKFDKGDFIGREALQAVKQRGVSRNLVGFTVEDERAIPRSGYDIVDADHEVIGFVTSGSQSITLGRAIGMGYVPTEHAAEGTPIGIQIRGKTAEAIVTDPPFIAKR